MDMCYSLSYSCTQQETNSWYIATSCCYLSDMDCSSAKQVIQSDSNYSSHSNFYMPHLLVVLERTPPTHNYAGHYHPPHYVCDLVLSGVHYACMYMYTHVYTCLLCVYHSMYIVCVGVKYCQHVNCMCKATMYMYYKFFPTGYVYTFSLRCVSLTVCSYVYVVYSGI